MSDPPHPPVHTPFPLILAAPSGAGKTSIARELAARRTDVEFSISCTTRLPRPGERNGADYHFLSRDEFGAMQAAGELLEWAEVHGDLYGTPLANLEDARRKRHLLLLDIDVQGSRQVKRSVPTAVSVFVLPPSAAELGRRLVSRGSEDAVRQRRRLLTARQEIVFAEEFDYVVINDDLARSVATVEGIIEAEEARTPRLESLGTFVDGLLKGIDEVLEDLSTSP